MMRGAPAPAAPTGMNRTSPISRRPAGPWLEISATTPPAAEVICCTAAPGPSGLPARSAPGDTPVRDARANADDEHRNGCAGQPPPGHRPAAVGITSPADDVGDRPIRHNANLPRAADRRMIDISGTLITLYSGRCRDCSFRKPGSVRLAWDHLPGSPARKPRHGSPVMEAEA